MLLKAKQKSETQTSKKWDWVETSIWTERMLATLDNGVKGGKWFMDDGKEWIPTHGTVQGSPLSPPIK